MARTNHTARRAPFVSAGKRRQTEWFGSADVTDRSIVAADGIVLLQLLFATSLAKRPFTVIRVVGTLWTLSDQTASFETPFGGLGMAVVNDKAIAVGITAIPDPVAQEGSDLWFMYKFWAATVDASGERRLQVQEFDSRAMRKVDEGSDIAIMIGNGNNADAAAFVLKFRMLVKLS